MVNMRPGLWSTLHELREKCAAASHACAACLALLVKPSIKSTE